MSSLAWTAIRVAMPVTTWHEIRGFLTTSTCVHSLELVSLTAFSRSGSISLYMGLPFAEDILELSYLVSRIGGLGDGHRGRRE